MLHLNHDKNTNTLEIKETGIISIENKLKILEKVLEILKVQDQLKILHDSRDTEFSETNKIEEFKRIVIEEISKFDAKVYHAVIYNNPIGTAHSIIYEQANRHPNYIHKVFSTEKAAVEWLKKL